MKARVFIIDPDQKIRHMVKYHLISTGISDTHDFHSVDECFYLIRKNITPHFIVTTLDTGRHQTEEFISEILKINPLCKIIFFDHFDIREDVERLLEWGAADYVSKSHDIETGIRMVIRNIKYLHRDQLTTQS